MQDINGNYLYAASDANGDRIHRAYDINGNMIWSDFFYAVHLDIGSKYISATSIKSIIDSMASASDRISILQLDFSKNRGFRLALNDSTVTASDGNTYDLTGCYGNSNWDDKVDPGNNYWLTESEMTEVVQYAHSKGIDICPCFTMPGNMFAFMRAFPDFWYASDIWGQTTLNFKNQRAVNFIVAVVKKYARYFASLGCKYWNFGCDEVGQQNGSGFQALYSSGQFGILTNFIKAIAKTVSDEGLAPRMWNDCILWAGDKREEYSIPRSIQVCYWAILARTNMQRADTLSENDFILINSPNGMYYCPVSSYPPLSQEKFNNFIINRTTFEDGSVVPAAIGAMWCIWFPNPVGITEADAVSTIQTYLSYYGNAIRSYG